VDIRDVIAHGVKPAPHRILDVKAFFGLKRAEDAERLILVNEGDVVDEMQPLAGRSATSGKRLFAPSGGGTVVAIHDGRIILQELPTIIDLEAGVRGRVTQVFPQRGAAIETTGAQVQGVWGNDHSTIATLRIEPEAGIENIISDQLEMRYLGAVIVTKRQLKPKALAVMEEQGFAGIIAPSMDYTMREQVLAANGAVMLTEGFGDLRMNRAALNLLTEFEGQQATIDAYQPRGWESRRPEVIINQAAPRGGESPMRLNIMLTTRTGMTVRVTRDPYMGQTGRILDLPKSPLLLENGLRVLSAQLELATGEKVIVPLANLEILGR
jgi:hypothetical protein